MPPLLELVVIFIVIPAAVLILGFTAFVVYAKLVMRFRPPPPRVSAIVIPLYCPDDGEQMEPVVGGFHCPICGRARRHKTYD